MALAAVLLGCLNAPSTGAKSMQAPLTSDDSPLSPQRQLQSLASLLSGASGRAPDTSVQARAGHLVTIGPRPANAFAKPPTKAELRSGRVTVAQLLQPTQPYVPVASIPIRIGFDGPVEQLKVAKSFKTTPTAKGRLEWLDERTLNFVPEQLAYDTTYTVSVSVGPLLAEWQWSFTTVKEVTISIDDCASTAGELRNVLAVLAQKHLHAVMFPTGLCNANYPWLVPQMLAEGHTVCNHTYSHPRDLTKLTDAQITTEIQTGVHAGNCNLFRPPWGAWDGPGGRVERIAASLGYRVYMWDVDTLDWAGASSADILTRIRARGGVILLHYHGKYTVEALRQL